MSIDGWKDKQNLVCAHNGILFSLKKEGNPAICDNMMDLKHIMLSEISQTEKDKYCMLSHMQNLKKLNKQAKWNENRFIDAENKGVTAKGEGVGGWNRWRGLRGTNLQL